MSTDATRAADQKTTVHVHTPDHVSDEPEAYLNSAGFAVVTLSPNVWFYAYDPEHARKIAAAWTRAADLLEGKP